MTSADACKYSYLRASREIIPSSSLVGFLENARDYVDKQDFETDSAVQARIFAVDSLRVTLFERRVLAATHINETLRKVHADMEAPRHIVTKRVRTPPRGTLKNKQVEVRNPLPSALQSMERLYTGGVRPHVVRAIEVVDCTKGDYKHLGIELGLVIGEGGVASMLEAQAGILADASLRKHAGRSLPEPAEPDQPLVIPFMRAPFADEGDRDEFISLLQPDLPVTGIGIGPIQMQLKTVSP